MKEFYDKLNRLWLIEKIGNVWEITLYLTNERDPIDSIVAVTKTKKEAVAWLQIHAEEVSDQGTL